MKLKGADISSHNGVCDFFVAKNSGLDFVILRASYGRNERGFKNFGRDKNFEKNYISAKKAGLMVGAYHFFYANNSYETLKEAWNFYECIKDKKFEFPIFIDIEDYIGKLKKSSSEETNLTLEFINFFEKRNFFIGVYANRYYFDNRLLKKEFGKRPLWIAHYGNYDYDKSGYGMWQYTEEGNFKGLCENRNYVDLNVSYANYFDEVLERGVNGYMKNWVVHYSRDEDFECASMIAQNLHILMVDGRIMVDFSKYDRVIYVGVERSGASSYTSDYILEDTKLNRKKSCFDFYLKNKNI